MALFSSDSSITSSEQHAIDALLLLKGQPPRSISPINIPAKRNHEQACDSSNNPISNSNLSNASTCCMEASSSDKPCSPPLTAAVVKKASASESNREESIDNVEVYFDNKFKRFRVQSQPANEESNHPVEKYQKLLIAEHYDQVTSIHQPSPSSEIPSMREVSKESLILTYGPPSNQRRQEEKDLTMFTDVAPSSTTDIEAVERDSSNHTNVSLFAEREYNSTPAASYDTELLFNIVVDEACPPSGINTSTSADQPSGRVHDNAMDIDEQFEGINAAQVTEVIDAIVEEREPTDDRLQSHQPEPSIAAFSTVSIDQQPTFHHQQQQQHQSFVTADPSRPSAQPDQPNSDISNSLHQTIPIDTVLQNTFALMDSDELKERVCSDVLAVERETAVMQQRLRQLRKERSAPNKEQNMQALLDRIEHLNRCKDQILISYHKAQESQQQQQQQQQQQRHRQRQRQRQQQQSTQQRVPGSPYVQLNTLTTASMPVQIQSHAQQYQDLPTINQQQQPLLSQLSPAHQRHLPAANTITTATSATTATTPTTATATTSIPGQPRLLTAAYYPVTEERWNSEVYELAEDTTSEDEREEADDEADTKVEQILTTGKSSKSGEKKPRWTSALRSTLFKSIVRHKQLDDMASFHWSSISAQVGRSGKSCKDQWRRTMLPKLIRTMTEEEGMAAEGGERLS